MQIADSEGLRTQLLDRRSRLEGAIAELDRADDLVRLLREVDSALERLDAGSYGRCEACHEEVGDDFLQANPLIQYCLCQLSPEEQRALQHDLDLASRVQWQLLPKPDLRYGGYEVHYRYLPLGPVSGDYCDLVAREDGGEGLHVLLGDVSGKGVAAAFLMARLNALFRSLLEEDLPVQELVERANRLIAENTLPSQYATLVCARADGSGTVEICNAGHCPPLLVSGHRVETVDSSGFPVGLFRGGRYAVHKVSLAPGDTLFLYTDGLTEARNAKEEEYGAERLTRVLREAAGLAPRRLAEAVLRDQREFVAGQPRSDDLTLMVVRRTEG